MAASTKSRWRDWQHALRSIVPVAGLHFPVGQCGRSAVGHQRPDYLVARCTGARSMSGGSDGRKFHGEAGTVIDFDPRVAVGRQQERLLTNSCRAPARLLHRRSCSSYGEGCGLETPGAAAHEDALDCIAEGLLHWHSMGARRRHGRTQYLIWAEADNFAGYGLAGRRSGCPAARTQPGVSIAQFKALASEMAASRRSTPQCPAGLRFCTVRASCRFRAIGPATCRMMSSTRFGGLARRVTC